MAVDFLADFSVVVRLLLVGVALEDDDLFTGEAFVAVDFLADFSVVVPLLKPGNLGKYVCE